MIPDEPNGLLREVVADDAVERLRQNSLGSMLRVARRRRVVRRTRRVGAVLCMVGAAVWLLAPRPEVGSLASATSRTKSATPSAEAPPSIKQISDAELLALFPGQTVALIGPPGNQRLLVLGASP